MKHGHLIFAALTLVSLALMASAACTGSCTYYPSGTPSMISWSASCSGSSTIHHVAANALVGTTGYPCSPGDSFGNSIFTTCSGVSSGQESWLNNQGTITAGSIQVVDTISNVYPIICSQSGGGGGGGGGGGTGPGCASYTIRIPIGPEVNTQDMNPAPDFWGYNWTQSFVDAGGGIPSRLIQVDCKDSQGNNISCPEDPTFSATAGTLVPDPVSNSPTMRIWKSANRPTPVTISASMNACGGGTRSISFNLHILDACSLSPNAAVMDMGKNQTFSGTCYDETRQGRPCDYPLMMHVIPNNALGMVSENTPPTGIPPDRMPAVGDRGVRMWLDSTVNFTAGFVDAIGELSGAGPTFVCAAPITIGNPATACTLGLSATTVPAGRTIQATPSCTGPRGPTECPDMEFWSGPAAVVTYSNYSQANVTGLFAGTATVHAVSAGGRQTCALDQKRELFNLDTPIINTCTYVPHDATSVIYFPIGATNIRAYLAGGGTDDGCTKVDVNGQRVFDEGCDAGYRSATCGNYVIAHDLNLPAPIRLPLKPGANSLHGSNIDTFGQYATLRLRVAGSYQTDQCPDPALRSFPLSCQADLTVTYGACNTPPRVQTFNSESTRFDLIQPELMQSVPNAVLARADIRLAYASDIYACGQDFDGGIRSAPGFLAVDAARFHATISHPAMPVSITLRNVAGNQAPRIFVLDEFALQPSDVLQRGADCASLNRCTNVQFDPQAHTVTFQAPGFSSYAAEGSDTPTTGDDAQYVIQTPPPLSMRPGQTAGVSITMRNNGTTTWTDCIGGQCGVYRLGLARNGQVLDASDPAYGTWGINPVFLSASQAIMPSASKTFGFQVTAPLTEGTYIFQWRMARQTVGFGESTPAISVQVSATASPPPPSPSPPVVSPSPEPSPTPPGVSPSPSVNPPTVSPPIDPVSRPAAFVRIHCPQQLIISKNVSINTMTKAFGEPTCNPAARVNVTGAKGKTADALIQDCADGRSTFVTNTLQDGNYRAWAEYNGSTDTCLFAVAGTPPQATPEINPLLIILVAAVAGFFGQRKR